MKRFPLLLAVALVLSTAMFAQQSTWNQVQPTTTYTFQDVNYPNDTFTQLLGINYSGTIAGYHNFASNSGFTLKLPNTFTTENYPNSSMTQVIGINNNNRTVGFYVDKANVTHGFRTSGSSFFTVDFPGSAFNQLLGTNNKSQAAGYYSMTANNSSPDFPYIYDENGGVFEVIYIPGAVGGAQATGINDTQSVSGFYIDSKGVNHGFLLSTGVFTKLDFPGSTFTQALGLNNKNQVVGTYFDNANAQHGFVYTVTSKTWQSIDDPNGVGTTVVNGINDKGVLVGFWGTAPTNTGFVATP